MLPSILAVIYPSDILALTDSTDLVFVKSVSTNPSLKSEADFSDAFAVINLFVSTSIQFYSFLSFQIAFLLILMHLIEKFFYLDLDNSPSSKSSSLLLKVDSCSCLSFKETLSNENISSFSKRRRFDGSARIQSAIYFLKTYL